MSAEVDGFDWEAVLADWQRRGNNLATVHAVPVLVSAVLWTLVHECSGWVLGFFLNTKLDLPPTHSFKWRSRVVSFFFSLTILVGAFYGLLFDPLLQGDSFTSYSTVAYYTITTAVGFFLWDVIICARHYDEFRFPLLFHGIACLLTFVSFLDGKFMYYGCFYLTFEASTPFLNMQWLLEKMNARPSLKLANGVLLLSSFFVFRIALGIGYSFLVWQDINERLPAMTDSSDRFFGYYYTIAMLSLSLLNVYWFYLLCRLMVARITGTDNSSKKTQ